MEARKFQERQPTLQDWHLTEILDPRKIQLKNKKEKAKEESKQDTGNEGEQKKTAAQRADKSLARSKI